MNNVKLTMLLTSLTLLMTSNTQTLNLNAASEESIVTSEYGQSFLTLSKSEDLIVEDQLPSYDTISYPNQSYRDVVSFVERHDDNYEDATKYLFPFNMFMDQTQNNVNYLQTGNTVYPYATIYYDYCYENIKLSKVPALEEKMSYITEITNLEWVLTSFMENYHKRLNTKMAFDIPIVKIDDVDIFGAVLDFTTDTPQFYYYSNVGTLSIIKEGNYQFMKFEMPFKDKIYKITKLNYEIFSSLDSLNDYTYPERGYTTFIPGNEIVANRIEPFLFDVADIDIENKTISFANFTGHDNSIILTINNNNVTESINDFIAEKVVLGIETADSLNTSTTSESLEFSLTFKEKVNDLYVYTINDFKDLDYFQYNGSILVEKVTYEIKTDNYTSSKDYYSNFSFYDGDRVDKFFYYSVEYKYSHAQKIDTYICKDPYDDTFGNETKMFAGGFYMPNENLDGYTFGQVSAFTNYNDVFKQIPYSNIYDFRQRYYKYGDTTTRIDNTLEADFLTFATEGTNQSLLEEDINNLFYCYLPTALVQDQNKGYNIFNNEEYDFLAINYYTNSIPDSRNANATNIKVENTYAAYDAFKFTDVNTSTINDYPQRIYWNSQAEDFTGFEEVEVIPEVPSDEKNDDSSTPNQDSSNDSFPSTDDTNNDDSILKDLFNKEDLTDNLKSILPIGLGVIGIIAVLALIFKKKK